MGENDHMPIFQYSALIALAGRLGEHADATLARKDVAGDMWAAARALHQFATFKFRIVHIATRVDSAVETAMGMDERDWNALIAALNGVGRELRDAIAEAERDIGEGDA